ncbi:DNA alkylation repair protein [Leptospira sp. 'Mane']|uniref:DNA alkylation repair protein n=1 Tax=Leptospira sp. 'Mane' TaxID=3387407 RepID=UPI00398A8547
MTTKTSPKTKITSLEFIKQLKTHQSEEEFQKIQRYFKSKEGEYGEGDVFIGVRMGTVFSLAKEMIEMPTAEIEKLLENKFHEVRAGALSIMDKQARSKKTGEVRRKELFDLYLKRTDQINNWDLVDLAAPHVVGGYLSDKPRDILYKLARSKNIWERRTSIVSTSYFIRKGELEDTFKIAEILVGDKEDLIHKATGGWMREAGKKNKTKLLKFLDQYAKTMPRTMLRYSIEHFDQQERDYYLGK